MVLRRLTIMMMVCLWAWAAPHARAALVMQTDAAYAPVPATGLVRGADIDVAFHPRALITGPRGEALCADRSLCQEWNDPFGDARQSMSLPLAGLLGRTTLLANVALLGIGVLWLVITRRSLRVAESKSRQG